MKKIVGIKCQNKFYITDFDMKYYKNYRSLEEFLIDGQFPSITFHSEWVSVGREPKIIQKYEKQPNINYRYELKDSTLVSPKTPLTLQQEYVEEQNEDGNSWKEEFAMFRSMYQLCSDEQSDILINIDFQYETIMEVKEIKEFGGFNYDVQKTPGEREGLRKITEDDVQHQLLDEIIFPNILLSSRPCLLTPQQTYDIIRQYVKQHINYDIASITSDYDFCFTVKKKILLSEPTKYTIDVNNLMFSSRKRKPKYEIQYKTKREVECFEMAPKQYQKYTVISGFKGNDQEELEHKIDMYCKSLVDFINTPIRDCPYCKGSGILLEDTFKMDMGVEK